MGMAGAYLRDKKRICACAALCEGEYGVHGLFIGVPARIGAGGMEKIYEIKLTDEEKGMLNKTVEEVKKTVAECKV
jgi:malate dehydrogenase